MCNVWQDPKQFLRETACENNREKGRLPACKAGSAAWAARERERCRAGVAKGRRGHDSWLPGALKGVL